MYKHDNFKKHFSLTLIIIICSLFLQNTGFAQDRPDIRIELAVTKTTAKIGETLTYTITITDSGSSDLTNVKLNSSRLGIVDNAIYGGSMSRGAVGIIQGTFTLEERDLPGPLVLVATVSSDQTGTATATVNITLDGYLATPEIDPIYIGQTVSWEPIRACDRKCLRWQLYQTNQTGDWEIFRLDDVQAEAGTPINISKGAGPNIDDIAPTRSPNGDWVAFSSNRDGNWEVYIARDNGTDLQRVTENVQADDLNPVWGPNNYVVFQSNRDGNWNLYLFDTATGRERKLTDSKADNINPTWSPDGTTVAFQTNRDGRWQIYSVQVQSGTLKQLSNGDRDDFEPVYSPDGNQIAFRAILYGKTNNNVFVMGAQGGRIIPVSNFKGNASHPAWSPDSSLLAYQSDVDGTLNIYSYNMSSGVTNQLTKDNGNNYAPSFLCDSNRVLFSSDVGGKFDVYQMDPLQPDQSPIRLTTTDGDNVYSQSGGTTELNSGTDLERMPVMAQGHTAYPTVLLKSAGIEPTYPRSTAWNPINACETTCNTWSVYMGKQGKNWFILRQDDASTQPLNLSRPTADNTNFDATNFMPAVSPNGAWVVFVSNRNKYWELYISSTDGSVFPRRLTYTKATERNPVWSADGQSILYESNRDGNWKLYHVDIVTRKEERLTFNEGDDTHARWSPDASRIVFESNRTGRPQIYQLDLQTNIVTILSDGKSDDSQPEYAADSHHIAYRSITPTNPNGQIIVVAIDGTGAKVVSDLTEDASNPVWSNTGLVLAYQALKDGAQAIYEYDAASDQTRQVIAGSLNAYAPAWHCDGTTLIVNIGQGDQANIYTLDKSADVPVSTFQQLGFLSNLQGAKVYSPYTGADGQAWEQPKP